MLEAKELGKKYGEINALQGLNFTVKSGEIFCLLGQNGAGKTTTINIFLGLIAPTTGKALINGESISENPSLRNKIAYIPEIV